MKDNTKTVAFAFAALLFAVPLHAQLNCSGGYQNCAGTPTGTGVNVLKNNPVLTTPNIGDSVGTTLTLNSTTTAIFINPPAGGTNFIIEKINDTSGSGYILYNIVNSSGNTYIGNGGSTSASVFTGNLPYATVFGSNALVPVQLGMNGTIYVTISSSSAGSVGIGSNATAPLSQLAVNGPGTAGYTFSVDAGTSRFNGRAYAANLTTSASNQTDSVCLSASGEMLADTQVGGCIVSTADVKNILGDLTCADAIRITNGLKPIRYQYKNIDMPANRADWSEHFGFTAEQVAGVEPRLAMFTREGKPRGVQYELMTAVLTKAFQCTDRPRKKFLGIF